MPRTRSTARALPRARRGVGVRARCAPGRRVHLRRPAPASKPSHSHSPRPLLRLTAPVLAAESRRSLGHQRLLSGNVRAQTGGRCCRLSAGRAVRRGDPAALLCRRVAGEGARGGAHPTGRAGAWTQAHGHARTRGRPGPPAPSRANGGPPTLTPPPAAPPGPPTKLRPWA